MGRSRATQGAFILNLIKPRTNIKRGDGVTGNTLDYLVSTTVTNNEADWDVSTAYVVGDKAVLNFDLYQCLQNNTGENPTDAASTYWVRAGSANKYAMFDGNSSSQTEFLGTNFTVVITGLNVNSLSFFGVNADSITVTQTDGGVQTFTETKSTGAFSEGRNNWYNFYYMPFPDSTSVRSVVFSNIPILATSQISITFNKASGNAKCGMLVDGMIRNIGTANFGTDFGITDYSTKETDQFGNTEIVERPFNRKINYDVSVPTLQLSQVDRLLAAYRATPVCWIGEQTKEETIIFGFINDSDFTEKQTLSSLKINVEGI